CAGGADMAGLDASGWEEMIAAFLLFRSMRGREARPAGVGFNAGKTLVQIVVMWTIFYFLLPIAVYFVEDGIGLGQYRFASTAWQIVGVVGFVGGGMVGLTCAWLMVTFGRGTPLPADCPRELVIKGPYRYVRNPMAVSSFLQGMAIGLWLGSPLVVLYVLAGMVGWNYFVRPWEEMDLERRFGAPYARYRERVRCWVPNLRPYEG
ncbi:MAG: isoprenylcysteine carboxylmethyltransferase family protein, partial [Chloroflexia bacterium]